MSLKIAVKPVKMTEEIMQMLEDKGLIIRLGPGRHSFPIEKHGCDTQKLYVSQPQYGSHMLISVVVDRIEFSAFGTHEDNEEFLLLGGAPEEKGMYLLIALCKKEELDAKLAAGKATADDFVCLDCVFNNPQLSFFVMLKDVPHGEATPDNGKLPASFYVTEPSGMGLVPTNWHGHVLEIL